MKNSFHVILALTIVGLLALVIAACYFGAPLFGWIIMAAIFAVFIGEQLGAIKTIKLIQKENFILENPPSDWAELGGEGVVGKRMALAYHLLGCKIRLDSPMAYEVLSNSVAVTVPKSAGGTVNDLRTALQMMSENRIHPEVMITHVGGLDAVIDTTMNLPKIPGGKKIIYPGIRMPLTAIVDFAELGRRDPLFAELAACCELHGGLWNASAEKILLKHFNII